MAFLSKKNASDRAFVLGVKFMEANGFNILECLPYSSVHKVHSKNSWHYYWFLWKLKKHSRAADINWPAGGSIERSKLTAKVRAIRSFGIAVIFDMTGNSNGPTVTHKTHLHMDQGSYSNLGDGQVPILKCDVTVYDTQTILHVTLANKDNLNGNDTMNRLKLVQESSAHGGVDFPDGIKKTQQVIGAALTGKWDRQSIQAHDKTVKALKTLWKKQGIFTGTVNTRWDSKMDEALKTFNRKY